MIIEYSRGYFFPKTAKIKDPYSSLQKSINFKRNTKRRLLIELFSEKFQGSWDIYQYKASNPFSVEIYEQEFTELVLFILWFSFAQSCSCLPKNRGKWKEGAGRGGHFPFVPYDGGW